MKSPLIDSTATSEPARYFRSKSGKFLWRFQGKDGRLRATDDVHWLLAACTLKEMRPEDELTEEQAAELCGGKLFAPTLDQHLGDDVADQALQRVIP